MLQTIDEHLAILIDVCTHLGTKQTSSPGASDNGSI